MPPSLPGPLITARPVSTSGQLFLEVAVAVAIVVFLALAVVSLAVAVKPPGGRR